MSVAISKAAFARKLGVSKAAVSRYVSMGLPVTIDGCIDPAIGARWVKDNVRVQSGARGRGIRGAARLNGDRRRNGQDDAALREHTRLLRLRADRLELENARLKGGTSDERARRMAETVALRAWWAFQRAAPSALARALADRVGRGNDKQLMYLLTDVILQRDQIVMRDIFYEMRDGFGGKVQTRDNPLVGAPWLDSGRTGA